jgi:hypothetical protein
MNNDGGNHKRKCILYLLKGILIGLIMNFLTNDEGASAIIIIMMSLRSLISKCILNKL